MRVRTGDTVLVNTGKDRGKQAKVIRAMPSERRVIVEGVNIAKKHLKPTPKHPHGGIVEIPAPLHVSNVDLICGSCSKSTRVGMKTLADGSRVRVCKRCGEAVSPSKKKVQRS